MQNDILAAVTAAMGLVVAFDVVLTAPQQGAIIAFAGGLMAVGGRVAKWYRKRQKAKGSAAR